MKLHKSINILFTLILLIIIPQSSHAASGGTEIRIVRTDSRGHDVYMGDIVNLQVIVDTHGEKITGVNFYLTFDSYIFHPVFNNGLPFVPGTFLLTSYANINNTHKDSLHLGEIANGIPGFQLDYYQSTGPAFEGHRPYAQGIGVIASFELEVVGMTNNPNDSTIISFDFDYRNGRHTRYFEFDKPGTEQKFRTSKNYAMSTAGFRFDPPIPDTMITPGSRIMYELKDYTKSNTKLDLVYNCDVLTPVSKTKVELSSSQLSIITEAASHGLMQLQISATQKQTGYIESQDLKIGIDKLPTLKNPLPTIQFDEDTPFNLAKNLLVNDKDDPMTNILVQSTQNGHIHLMDQQETLRFQADENWYGSEILHVFIKDSVQAVFKDSLETVLNIKVNPVNDPPQLDLSTLEPLTVYHGVLKTITFQNGVQVSDVDDVQLSFTATSSDPSKLKSFFTGNVLNLETQDKDYTGIIPITIGVKDAQNLSDTQSINVNIEAIPVRIKELPAYILYPDSNIIIRLNDYVEYPENLKETLLWYFEIKDEITNLSDPNVIVKYDSVLKIVEISAISGHRALDNLYVTVYAGKNNVDTEVTCLKISDVSQLTVFPLPDVTMMQHTRIEAIYLDLYVLDPLYDPAEINWNYVGGDSLQEVVIDTISHLVILATDSTFLGDIKIEFIATSQNGNTASAIMTVHCIEFSENPVISPLPEATFYWKTATPQIYVDLDDYVWDFGTPDSLIEWSVRYDSLLMNLQINKDQIVTVTTSEKRGTEKVVFTARDHQNFTASCAVLFNIRKSEPPVWKMIPTIQFGNNQIFSELYLNEFCRDPAGKKLTYSALNYEASLDVLIDPTTSRVMITPLAGFSGHSTIIFKATNEDTSSVSNLVDVCVNDRSCLSCFTNSVTPQQVNFVVNTDAQVYQLSYQFIVDTTSQHLQFTLIDSSTKYKIWRAPYTFQNSGNYVLKIELHYPNGQVIQDSMFLASHFSNSSSGVFFNHDKKLSIQYDDAILKNGFFLLTEKNTVSEKTLINSDILYRIQSEHKQSKKLTIQYSFPNSDCYHSFYEIDENNNLIPIQTVTDHQGNFRAQINTNTGFLFKKSENPALTDILLSEKIICYPNPFNHNVKVKFYLAKKTDVDVIIFNILGQKIFAQSFKMLGVGPHDVIWDGVDENQRFVPSGIYFISVSYGSNKNICKKVTLIK